ncbi:MAG TPA: secondary thiamine-phosphate synthase enzyme YjbQ [Rhizomicrobium sp.]|nr:secondary thiamine-phosphate synthase enzyme YjbQ [Rhizomicrobium sp.]
MRQAAHRFAFRTRGRGLNEITTPLKQWLADQGMAAGLLTLFCRHTSASLLIQENADPDVRADLERYFERIAPEAPGRYAHEDEGPDDMPGHLRAALTQTSLSIPVAEGRMVLGTWQGIHLFEHRARPHEREVAAHLIGE